MKSKIKLLTLSLLTILCCTALVVVGTAALFTGESTVSNTIKAGKLDFEFTRTSIQKAELEESTGYIVEGNVEEDGTEVKENALSLNLIAPGSYVEGIFNLENTGDTAFAANLAITVTTNVVEDSPEEALLAALLVTVTVGSEDPVYEEVLFSALDTIELGNLTVGADTSITIRIELPAGGVNGGDNDFALATIDFSLALALVQALSA